MSHMYVKFKSVYIFIYVYKIKVYTYVCMYVIYSLLIKESLR